MRVKILNIIFLVLFFANAKGQTITLSLTTPNTTVCSGLDFPITVQSNTKIWVTLDISTDNGVTWANGNIFNSTTLSSGVYQKTYSSNNINVTTRFRLRYSLSSDNSNPQTYEPPGLLVVTLYTTPVVQASTLTQCANAQFSFAPTNGGGNVVPTGTTYTWTYTATSAVTGATSNSTFGTSSITQSVLNGTNSITTLTYNVTPKSAEGCPGDPFNLTVILNPVAQLTTINDLVCSASTYSKTFTDITDGIVPSGTTYNWTYVNNNFIQNESASSSNTSSFTQTINNTTNGTQTVTYTVTPTSGTCPGPSFTLNLGVKPKPFVSTQTTSICSGSSFSFQPTNGGSGNNIVPTSTTYTWTFQPNASVTGHADQSIAAGTISGTIWNSSITQTTQIYDVTPYANGCTGDVFEAQVSLLPNPLINDKSPTAICSGGVLGALTIRDGQNGDVVPSGTSYTWVISSDNTNLTGQYPSTTSEQNFAQNNPITLVNSSNINQEVKYTVTAASAGCTPTTFLVTVTVVPVAVIHDKTRTICSGSSFNVPLTNGTDDDIIVAGTTYTWTTSANTLGATGTSTPTSPPISQTLTNTTAAPQSVNYNVTSSSATCASTNFTITVVVNAVPTISNYSSTFCSGGNLTFDPSTISGNKVPANTYYTWTAPTNSNITGQTASSANPNSILQSALTNTSSAIQSMTYFVTPTSPTTPSCPGNTFNVDVFINPMPSITNSSVLNPASICSGSTMTITPTDGGGNILPTGTTFTWTYIDNPQLSGQTNLSNQSSIVQTITNNSNANQNLTYNVVPTSPTTPSCSGATFSIQQLVKPVVKIASNTISICSGTYFTSSPSNTSPDIVPDGTTYSWSIPSTTVSGTSSSTSPQTSISQLLTNNTNTQQNALYYISPIAQNGCASSSYTLTVNVEPTPVIGNTSLSSPICSGAGFTKIPVNGNGDIVPSGTTYTWTIPANSNVSGISSVNIPQNNIAQTPNNLTSSTQSLTYTITPSTTLGCSGQAFTLGMSILPTAIISDKTPNAICSGNAFSVPLSDGSGGDVIPGLTNYTWTVVDNPNISGDVGQSSATSVVGQTLTSISNTAQQVVYSVLPILSNGCNANAFTTTVTVNPVPKIASTSDNVCSNFDFFKTFTNGNGDIVPSDIEYKWVETIHDNYISGQTSQLTYVPTFNQLLSNLTGSNQIQYYTITPHTQTGCLGLDFNLALTVKATPKIISNANGVTSCSGSAFPAFQPVDVTNGDIVPAGTQYTWTVSSNSNLTGQSNQALPQNSISQIISNKTNINQNLTYSVRATAANSCYSDFSLDFVSKPTTNITNNNYAICTNGTFDATPSNTDNIIPNGTKYTWTIGTNANITGAGNQISSVSTITQLLKNASSIQQSIVYHVQPVLLNNCSANTFDATIVVNPLPVVSIAVSKSSLCIGESATLTASGANQYVWTGGITNAVSFTPSQTYT